MELHYCTMKSLISTFRKKTNTINRDVAIGTSNEKGHTVIQISYLSGYPA